MQKINRGEQIGPFTIDRELSKNGGGMSFVYLAKEAERNNLTVALKITRTDQPAYQDLLRREADMLSDLRHPGIVRVYPQTRGRGAKYSARAATHPATPWYYAMEYLPHGTLENHLHLLQSKPFEWTMELFYHIVTTVHFMHNSGYAHCDLKPQNIMFRMKPNVKGLTQFPHPVLVDFGSAVKGDRIHQLSASVPYAPPELVLALSHPEEYPADKLIPQKIDIWGLGILLFEIVTGRAMFNQRNRDKVTTRIIAHEIEEMRRHRRGVDRSLDTLLKTLLKRDPTERPGTGLIIQALEAHIESIRPPRVAN